MVKTTIVLTIAFFMLPMSSSFAGSIVNNGDNTVTDESTGLMWAKSYGSLVMWDTADYACRERKVAGYSDWRTPTATEIKSFEALYYSIYGSVYNCCGWTSDRDNIPDRGIVAGFNSSTNRPFENGEHRAELHSAVCVRRR